MSDGIASAQPGDFVKSRWSSSGALWEVVDTYEKDSFGVGYLGANLRSVKTGRIDTRKLADLVLVRRAGE